MIEVIRPDGKKVKVTEKMFEYMYKHKGFKKVGKPKEKVDKSKLYTLKNEELHKLLDEKEIPYKLTDTKSQLVDKLIG